jgi:hypothetical protein
MTYTELEGGYCLPWEGSLSRHNVVPRSNGSRQPRYTPEILAADAAAYARIQAANHAVMVEAFAVAVVIGPDEPAPYYPTELGEMVPCPGPRPDDLSPRQRKIIKAIRESLAARGYPPTLREIAEAAGLSSLGSVHHQLRSLEAKGVLTRGGSYQPRAITLRVMS